MAKTLGTLLTEFGHRVDDDAHRRFSAQSVREWINEGGREIARKTECLFVSGTPIPVTADTQDYLAPIDTVRIHMLTFEPDGDNQSIPLDYRDIADMPAIWGTYPGGTSAWPDYYTTFGFPPAMTIKLYPTPALDGDLTVYYYRFPTQLATDGTADATALDLPTGWEDLTLDYAEAKAYRKDRRLGDYQAAMQTFQANLAAIYETAVRYNDAPGQISPDLRWSAGSDEYAYW